MKTLRRLDAVFISLTLCLFATPSRSPAEDALIRILDDEMQREMQVLEQQNPPAYYLSYRVDEISSVSIGTSFGTLTRSDESKARYLTLTVRVGSPELDNYHPIRGQGGYASSGMADLPLADEPLAIQQALWSATSDAYQQAVASLAKAKANVAVKTEEEDKSPDFWLSQSNILVEPPLKPEDVPCHKTIWEQRLKQYSAAFLRDPAIFSGSSSFDFQITRKSFVSTSGDKIAQNSTAARIGVVGTIKAKDGMEMPLVCRIYTDGRPDEVVRGVDLIGTPLSMFSQIDQAGGTTEVFNGTCGAESGGVPVSAICPMLLVKTIETQKRAKSQERSILLPRPDSK